MDERLSEGRSIKDLVQRIGEDLKVIARDEVELGRSELRSTLRHTAFDAGAILLSGIVALIGFGMLCVAVAVALEPAIEPLWARLVLMAAVYMVLGGGVAGLMAKRLKHDATTPLKDTRIEAKRTTEVVKEELRHA